MKKDKLNCYCTTPDCTDQLQCRLVTDDKLWIFGYGSLIWKPNFEYCESCNGVAHGYKRRFWQGNTYHRGTQDCPAAVATLVPASNEVTWGTAFCLHGNQQIRAALDHVILREVTRGGYRVEMATFQPGCCYGKQSNCPHQIPVLVFYAETSNDLYLKVRDVPSVARLICKSKGKCGDNLEYLQHLVEALKRNFPPCAYDDHLRELVSACDVIKKKICDVTTETDCCGSDKENRLTMVLSNEFTNN